MSFSYDTKNELCRLPVQRRCCAQAEAYGILLYCHTFNAAEVRIITTLPPVCPGCLGGLSISGSTVSRRAAAARAGK